MSAISAPTQSATSINGDLKELAKVPPPTNSPIIVHQCIREMKYKNAWAREYKRPKYSLCARELSIYSNSGYVYAARPIALALFSDKWVRETSESEPLSMLFAILTLCLNKTDVDNYLVSA